MIVTLGMEVEYDLARRLFADIATKLLPTQCSEIDVINAAKVSVGLAIAAAGEMKRLGVATDVAPGNSAEGAIQERGGSSGAESLGATA